MTRQQAINFLRSSGLSEEQIKEIQDAFNCYRRVSVVDPHGHKHDGMLDKSRMLIWAGWITCECAYEFGWEVKEVEDE